ncbi:MAG: hypothetical protein JXQ84_07900 [Rhodospirillaceae bacterium]|nr:hypothetical protein [Rhodospirillaceae bacterium]
MLEQSGPVWERAMDLLGRAPTWHELRRALDNEGLVDRLTAAGMQALLHEWHRHAAEGLTDIELRIELGFWSDGGSYAAHLRGFQAIPPTALVAQARVRGWFVRVGTSGTAIVNPPGARPMVIQVGPDGIYESTS